MLNTDVPPSPAAVPAFSLLKAQGLLGCPGDKAWSFNVVAWSLPTTTPDIGPAFQSHPRLYPEHHSASTLHTQLLLLTHPSLPPPSLSHHLPPSRALLCGSCADRPGRSVPLLFPGPGTSPAGLVWQCPICMPPRAREHLVTAPLSDSQTRPHPSPWVSAGSRPRADSRPGEPSR